MARARGTYQTTGLPDGALDRVDRRGQFERRRFRVCIHRLAFRNRGLRVQGLGSGFGAKFGVRDSVSGLQGLKFGMWVRVVEF